MFWNYIVIVAQPRDYTKILWIVHSKRMKFMVYESHLKKRYTMDNIHINTLLGLSTFVDNM